MSVFAVMSVSAGAVLILLGLSILLLPQRTRQVAKMFPRSRWPAWILTAIDLAWVAFVIHGAHLGRFEFVKPFIYPMAPIAFFLVIYYMDELLAPRALGGLLLLVSNPILNAARWYDTSWRLYMVVLVYIWVIVGMILVLSPFRFRKTMELILKNDAVCRISGMVGTLIGLSAVILAITLY